jgi:hypothetical protein
MVITKATNKPHKPHRRRTKAESVGNTKGIS